MLHVMASANMTNWKMLRVRVVGMDPERAVTVSVVCISS
jgi:hypothetical protein